MLSLLATVAHVCPTAVAHICQQMLLVFALQTLLGFPLQLLLTFKIILPLLLTFAQTLVLLFTLCYNCCPHVPLAVQLLFTFALTLQLLFTFALQLLFTFGGWVVNVAQPESIAYWDLCVWFPGIVLHIFSSSKFSLLSIFLLSVCAVFLLLCKCFWILLDSSYELSVL